METTIMGVIGDISVFPKLQTLHIEENSIEENR